MNSLLLMDTPVQERRRLLGAVVGNVGASNIRGFYLPNSREGLVVPDQLVAGRNWTHANSPSGRFGVNGKLLNFNGTSDLLTTPDAADLSFGNGAADSPFSVFMAGVITATGVSKAILTKNDTAKLEYSFMVNTAETLNLFVFDNSASATPSRTSNGAITEGSLHTFCVTYSGVGGPTPEAGIILYQDGVVIASSAVASGVYTAMEDLTATVVIGATTGGTAQFFKGQIGGVILAAGAFSAAQVRDLNLAFSSYLRAG